MCWDPARRERDVRAFDRGWAVYPDKNFTLYAWIYYLGGMMGQMEGEYPDACAFKVPAFMRKLHESGVKGVFIQEAEGSGYSYLFSQLELYLTLKLADDPSLNGDEMIDEYFYQYYGQGAAAMKQLYQEMENVKYDINNYPAEIRRGDQYNMLSESVVYKNLITPERAARWNKLLGKALSGTKDEYHARVLEYKVGVWDRMVQARKKYLTTTSK
jgi:hypothetical protein